MLWSGVGSSNSSSASGVRPLRAQGRGVLVDRVVEFPRDLLDLLARGRADRLVSAQGTADGWLGNARQIGNIKAGRLSRGQSYPFLSTPAFFLARCYRGRRKLYRAAILTHQGLMQMRDTRPCCAAQTYVCWLSQRYFYRPKTLSKKQPPRGPGPAFQ